MFHQPESARLAAMIVLEVPEGLEDLAVEELEQRLRPPGPVDDYYAGEVRFAWPGDLRVLLNLRSVTAAYHALDFAVPRPKALLGHQYFTALVAAARAVLALHPPGRFATLRLSAAGEDSAVMTRLKQELATQLNLQLAEDEGDLLIRLRRSLTGWEALIRLSPRPLSARSWRVCNYPGAANALVARALALLAEPRAEDRVLNVCCGSGTLLVERLLLLPAQQAIGCDIAPAAVACAQQNLLAAGMSHRVRLEPWDATALPLEDGSVTQIIGDLPFGQLSGSHAENARLYPAVLAEAARVAAPGARMALLTHELRLLEQAAERFQTEWALLQVARVRTGGIMPGIFVFERTS